LFNDGTKNISGGRAYHTARDIVANEKGIF